MLASVPGASELFGEAKDLGGGEWGITAGGGYEKRTGLIVIHPNDPPDINANKEVNENTTNWYTPDWSLEQTEIKFNNNLSEFENDKNVLQAMVNYYNSTSDGSAPKYGAFPSTAEQKADSFNNKMNIIKRPNILRLPSLPALDSTHFVDTYNCIDWAATACQIAGGTNCTPSHTGVRPGAGKNNNGLNTLFQGGK